MKDLETVLCHRHLRSQPRYPNFTLCPECQLEAPHEAQVVEAVVNYFSKSDFSHFFVQTEHKIQMGTYTGRTDIVLLNSEENFVAIAECKQIGVVTYGHEQLKSYLSATDTQLGIFANSTDPNDWEFYENLRQNRFQRIIYDQFEANLIRRPQPLEPTYTRRSHYARRRQLARRSKQQRD